MSKELELKIKAVLAENSEDILNSKLKSYNLGKEFNWAIVVLKLHIGNDTGCDSVSITLMPKVQYVTPFVTKELASKYCEELFEVDKLFMMLPIENGKININCKEHLGVVTNTQLKNSSKVDICFSR